ncbi:ribonuclease H-like protein [Athelia psychrophila]|uniref:ribonuclease H n=1 Tax=Athelia psychrophila TaxID=1759441 RepID=A0A166JRU3_9AGAM|nr:ribonuclease H-like protein [Fibularhizoctonia sp. CBS 109695]
MSRNNVPQPEKVISYTDGSCLDCRNEEARTGSGVWFNESESPRENLSIRVPGEEQTNNVGELVGFLRAIQEVSMLTPLDNTTDSTYVMNGLTIHLQGWEERGWIGVKNKEIWKATIAHLRARGAPTRIRWIKGHSGNEGNDGADELAGAGALKEECDVIDLTINPKFNLTGAQLSKMTQATAYAGIREQKKDLAPKIGAAIRLDMTRHAAKELTGKQPLDKRIWKSLQHDDFQRTIRIFFWKTMHRAEKVGEFWEKIENREENAYCRVPNCEKAVESMDHILTECKAPEGKIIWELAEKLWKKKIPHWPKIYCAGAVMACALADFRTPEGDKLTGANRLYRIIVSESAWLIWKLRCRRLFDPDAAKDMITEREVHNRWVKVINLRLDLDRAMTNPKYERKAIPRTKVLQTWRGTIDDGNNLPPDWTRSKDVCISIKRMEPKGKG